jgi:uncharacterized protein YjiS (DUF1127 family)
VPFLEKPKRENYQVQLLCALGHRYFPTSSIFSDKREGGVCVMFPRRMLTRFQEWFEVDLIRWRPAHLELEDDTDEQLKDIGLEPLKRNFTAVKPFWKL